MRHQLAELQIELSELRSRLAESEEDKKRLQFENEYLRKDKARTDAATRELQDQLNSTRLQLEDQAEKAGEWYGKAKEAEKVAEERRLDIERLQQRQSPLSSPPIAQGELLDTTKESKALHSEPLGAESNPQERTALGSSPVAKSEPPPGGPAVEAAVEIQRTVEETPHLTREQLGKRFGLSRETIRKWEQTGELGDRGWEPVPGTRSNPKNPRLYRRIRTSATK